MAAEMGWNKTKTDRELAEARAIFSFTRTSPRWLKNRPGFRLVKEKGAAS
jgi:hypothetical protein